MPATDLGAPDLVGAVDAAIPADAADGAAPDPGPAPDLGQPDPGPPDPGPVVLPDTPLQVRIATFNVRRFFDTLCATGSCGGNNYEEAPTELEFEARANEIALSIDKIDADVIVLEEVETLLCTKALGERVGDRYPVRVLGETGGTASLDVAIFAKGELLEERRHRDRVLQLPGGGTTTFSRELLELHLDIEGWRVVVFGAHYKSKNDDDPDRRLAEAKATHDIMLATAQEFPQALVVLGGDLNDTPGSPPLNALEAGGRLSRVAAELTGGADWTYRFFNNELAIDHLYLALDARGTFVAGTAEVIRDGVSGLGSSDHAALRGSFRLDP
jgi:endonuclease/exonuclease/phosphatase (EEP) superfamily protein YafD